jgi:uncharacterized membrane protein
MDEGASGDGRAAGRAAGLATWGGALVGVALGGFFDGILLHQILQWHHLFSLVERAGGLAAQVMWDGVFHLGMYAAAGVGVWLLWRGRAALARPGAGRRLAGWALVGFGGWHVADAIVSHWLLGIHRIRDASPTPLVWDLAWFAVFGLAFVAAGVWMLRRPADGGGGARRGAAALSVAVLVAGPWAALPPEGGAAEGPAVALAVFLPGTGFEAVHGAAAAAGGVPVWADAEARVWAIEIGPDGGAPWTLYRHGAVMVTGGPIAVGCLSWVAM